MTDSLPTPNRERKYALLAKAMILRAESYKYQADAIAYDDVRNDEQRNYEINRCLDLAEDYSRLAVDLAAAARESNLIKVVPAIGGLKTRG